VHANNSPNGIIDSLTERGISFIFYYSLPYCFKPLRKDFAYITLKLEKKQKTTTVVRHDGLASCRPLVLL